MPDRSSDMARGVKGWAIAGNFAFGVVGMVVVGWLLEKYVWPGASPWLMIGCAAAGVVAGGYRFIKDANEANRAFAGRRNHPSR
jgi:F0F1-type ATP synthase assembly protein I